MTKASSVKRYKLKLTNHNALNKYTKWWTVIRGADVISRKKTKWDTEHLRIYRRCISLVRIMHGLDTYLWKTSSSFISLSEESQFKLQKSLAWHPPMSVSLEATFAEEPSSYFLWPKSQFGLLSCISLEEKNQTSSESTRITSRYQEHVLFLHLTGWHSTHYFPTKTTHGWEGSGN